MLGNFSCFCCHLLTFFKINFFKKNFQEYYQSIKYQRIKSLDPGQDPGQDQQFFGPDLGPNYMQRLSADNIVANDIGLHWGKN